MELTKEQITYFEETLQPLIQQYINMGREEVCKQPNTNLFSLVLVEEETNDGEKYPQGHVEFYLCTGHDDVLVVLDKHTMDDVGLVSCQWENKRLSEEARMDIMLWLDDDNQVFDKSFEDEWSY